MATDKPTSTTPASQTKAVDLAALAARLAEHADGIEMVSARKMADDMALAGHELDRLVAGIRKAAAETSDATTQRALANLLGDPPEPT